MKLKSSPKGEGFSPIPRKRTLKLFITKLRLDSVRLPKWMGWETVQFVEIDQFCQRLLRKNFPNTPIHGDAKTFNARPLINTIDILTGGDPCQPNSNAGLRKGTKDDRFLWPEMFRIARELNVPWIVNENVSGSISNGVLDLKIDDLEGAGYTCQAYCIPTESVGALHQRERVWLIAYNADCRESNSLSRSILGEKEKGMEEKRNEVYQLGEPVDLWPNDSYTNFERFKEHNNTEESGTFTQRLSGYFGFGSHPHGNIPRNIIESGVMGMLHGLPEGMDYAHRGQRIKGTGNAIVPQVAFEIFKAIENFKWQPLPQRPSH